MKTTILLLFAGFFLARSSLENYVTALFPNDEMAFMIGALLIIIALWRMGKGKIKRWI